MKYVVSAESYFNSINESSQSHESLIKYFESIPESFWNALDRVDFSTLSIEPNRNHTDEQIFEHQMFILDNYNEIPNIIQNDDFLTRLGYDTIELRLTESYLETLELINESVLGSVWDFLKVLVADPDPIEMGLNVFRLVLDIIGLVPFTWAGFPIDIVANVMSALISIYKGDYFSAVLSVISAIDVTKASALTSGVLKPIAPILNKIFPILFRSGQSAVAVEKGVIALHGGIIKMGNKSLVTNVVDLFKGFGKFILGTVATIINVLGSFVKTALDLVTLGAAKKWTAKITQFTSSLAANIKLIGANFETATKILSEADTAAKVSKSSSDLAAAARTEAQKAAQAKSLAAGKTPAEVGADIAAATSKFDNKVADKYLTSGGYIGDLRSVVKSDSKFIDSISHLSDNAKDIAIAAKVENELLGQAKLVADRVLKDPKLAEAAKALGIAPSGKALVAITDPAEAKLFFETFLKDPKFAKNLSKAEIRAFTPFIAKPEAFIAGVKNFDDTVRALKALTKSGNKWAKIRAKPLTRIVSFITRLVWQKYGSMDCILQAGANKANELVMAGTNKVISAALTPQTTNEASTGDPAVDANNKAANDAAPDIDKLLATQLEQNEKAKEKIATDNKKDCGRTASAVKAIVGAHIAKFPGSLAGAGDPNMANDPKKAAEFEKQSTEYSKNALKAMGLDATIDAQHSFKSNSPIQRAYYADVYNEDEGVVSLNTSDQSRVSAVIKKMVDEGTLDAKQAASIEQQVMKHLEDGTEPEGALKIPELSNTNESLFLVKYITGLK